MNGLRHEIPTHLGVEDKPLLGLSVRQLTFLLVGVAGAYALWNGLPGLPLPARLAPVLACLLAGAVLALVRPCGRGLDAWAFAALRAAAVPRRCAWRRPEPDPAAWRPASRPWAELAPRPAWPAAPAGRGAGGRARVPAGEGRR
jgi:hypothetical protein